MIRQFKEQSFHERGEVIFYSFAVVAAAVVLWLRARRRQQRRQAMHRAAAELGFAFSAEKPWRSKHQFDDFYLLKVTPTARIRNMMRGNQHQTKVICFDHEYTRTVGKRNKFYRTTVTAFRLRSPVPAFELRPEDIGDRIGSAFGAQDIDFESHPEFSRRYSVKGQDPAGVRAAFNADVLSFFEREKGWSVECDGQWLLAYRFSRWAEPHDLRSYLDSAHAVHELFARR